MTRINLLPWREELRKQRQQAFIAMLALAAVVGAGVWGLGHLYLDGQITHQNSRNALLQNEIKELDVKIAKIRDLEETKRQLLSRMNVISSLQQGRPQIVRVFHELVTTLPEGVYLTSVKQAGTAMTLAGAAESNARISSYMENLDGSNSFQGSKLNVIQVKDANGRRISEYTLSVQQTETAQQADKPAAARGGKHTK